MTQLETDVTFDPAYDYALEELLAVEPPPEPAGFAQFWRARYEKASVLDPMPRLRPSQSRRAGFRVWDVEYRSSGGFLISGWLLEPERVAARVGIVVGHGYGGLQGPDVEVARTDAAYFVPCVRGLGRSARHPISSNPAWHVLHDLHDRDRYVLGGCVEDLWTGISALLELRPQLHGRIFFMGSSFGGGIGVMALAWDDRVARGHLNLPSFGHQPLRMQLPTTGSGASVQAFARDHVHVPDILAFYDGAVAARYVRSPIHLAAALFDPVVVPPGQFAIYNALPGPKTLFLRRAGHVEHPGRASEDRDLLSELRGFFRCDDEPRVSPLAQRPPGP